MPPETPENEQKLRATYIRKLAAMAATELIESLTVEDDMRLGEKVRKAGVHLDRAEEAITKGEL